MTREERTLDIKIRLYCRDTKMRCIQYHGGQITKHTEVQIYNALHRKHIYLLLRSMANAIRT